MVPVLVVPVAAQLTPAPYVPWATLLTAMYVVSVLAQPVSAAILLSSQNALYAQKDII